MQYLSVVEENNIYVAWEKDHRTKLEDYEYARGEPKVDAESTCWIDVAPPVMVLQMNRTKFNPDGGNNEKMQHFVKIESVLNCQRFMYKNRFEVEKRR